MRKHGKVLRWNAPRGFGFIRGRETDQEVFFHVKDFRSAFAPKEGDEVWFEEIHVGGKGPRAMNVFLADAPHLSHSNNRNSSVNFESAPAVRRESPFAKRQVRNEEATSSAGAFFFLVLAWLALIAWGVGVKRLPLWVPGLVIALNLLAFYLYWLDKYAAQKRQWRTSEKTLHCIALFGGWAGAWFAQRVLRHKSRKASFCESFWSTVGINCIGLAAWVMWPQVLSTLG